MNKPLIGVAAAVVIAAMGGWFYWHGHRTPPAVVQTPPTSATVVSPVAEDTIAHPLPALPSPSNAPLPALNDSDGALTDALNAASDGTAISEYLIPDSLVRHIVVTIDNLPRRQVAVEKRPLKSVPGLFAANGDELQATIDEQNFKRYRPMILAFDKVDVQRVVAVYVRFYPLFQKAYQDLGYPTGYFNDRLVQVIDSLLATPQIFGSIELTRPNVMYVFADPALEARPSGQKLLIRMGPDNAADVKAKLTELRAAITAAPPQH